MNKNNGKEYDVDGNVKGVVYRYVNIFEGDEYGWCYVGDTDNEKSRRNSWKNHSNQRYAGKKLNDARNKYGLESFRYEVLETIFAPEDEIMKKLDELEAYYIEKYDSIRHGYNTSKGGTGQKGVAFSADHRNKISQNHRKTQAQEAKDKISSSNKGHVVSEATRAKISQGNRGKKRTDIQKQAQSERMKGKAPEKATAAAKEWIKQNGGGYWGNHVLSASAKQNMKAAQQKRGKDVIAIYPDGTEKTFTTMLDAANACKMNVGSVAYAAKKSNRTCRNGMKFRFI